MAGPVFKSRTQLEDEYLQAAEDTARQFAAEKRVSKIFDSMGMMDPDISPPAAAGMRLNLNVVSIATIGSQGDLSILVAEQLLDAGGMAREVFAYVVGDCESCGRPTPLAPELRPPRQMTAGRALTSKLPRSHPRVRHGRRGLPAGPRRRVPVDEGRRWLANRS